MHQIAIGLKQTKKEKQIHENCLNVHHIFF